MQRASDGILSGFVSEDATQIRVESCDERIVGRYLLAMSSRSVVPRGARPWSRVAFSSLH